jgi:uncharacterized protein (TIGR02722 family)
MKRWLVGAAWGAAAWALVGCAGPRAFTRGQYGDPQEISMLDDQWNQNDMQLVAKKVVGSMEAWVEQAKPSAKPVVILGMPENRTSEHIDMQALYDQVKTALIQSGRFTFVDESARPEIAKEYEYQGSGYVDPSQAKRPGKQTAPEYFLKGRITSIVQQVGNDKVVYYKASFRLSDIETAEIVWTDEKEITKHFKKRSIGF